MAGILKSSNWHHSSLPNILKSLKTNMYLID